MIKMFLIGLLLVLMIFLVLGMVVAQAGSDCAQAAEGELAGEFSGPGSLGGYMGTGVSEAEIRAARKHSLGGRDVVESEYRSTAYVPAAGDINCATDCEFTASGIRVSKGKRPVYGIASNPRMNKYGALAYVWPNPYNWRGPFVFFDTGGNFDGSDGKYRVDFYMWGNASSKAMAWGSAKMVRVSKTPLNGSAGQSVMASAASSDTQPRRAFAAQRAGVVKLIRPTTGPMTSPFGQRWGRLHAGVDIAPPEGTPIVAAASGRVDFAGVMSGYGNFTCIVHAVDLTTCYGHQKAFARGLTKGAQVQGGQLIGYVGNTGHSTGPHLHFEVRKGRGFAAAPTDPAPYLAGSESVTPSDPTSAQSAIGCQDTTEGTEGPPEGEGPEGVKQVADWIDRQKYPYCYGGGHVTPARPSRGIGGCTNAGGSSNGEPPGLDCSSSTSMILQRAGLKLSTLDSAALMDYGKPGKGRNVTIWAKQSHVFLEIDGRHFSTSASNHRSGPGWIPARSTAGFTPRHPVGM